MRITTSETDGHDHEVVLDLGGNGTTSTEGDHAHEVSAWEVQEADGHDHALDVTGAVQGGEHGDTPNGSDPIAQGAAGTKPLRRHYLADQVEGLPPV